MLNEVRVGVGGDSCRPYVHKASELIEMFHKGCNKVWPQVSCLGGDQPFALRAAQGHSVVEDEPTLMA